MNFRVYNTKKFPHLVDHKWVSFRVECYAASPILYIGPFVFCSLRKL